ncbi:endonuclease/exonuclease/phosphatase family protein [Patescibacteria group bacterium]|nr:endonuclease/exonuclease/phosphatase family protein [Patescibacteria group bacterium]
MEKGDKTIENHSDHEDELKPDLADPTVKKHQETIKLLTYNTCYGLKSNTLISAYNSTYRVVHARKDPEEISQKSDFSEVFDMIKEHSPNIVVLNEIFDDLQTKPVLEELEKMGFKYNFVGNSGHHTKPLIVSTVLASKLPCENTNIHFTFPEGLPGSGGGAVGVYFKEMDLFLLGFHIACVQKHLVPQLKEIDDFYERIKSKYKNIILTGDFNREYEFYKKRSAALKEFNFVKEKRTFPSFFPIYKPFSFLSPNLVVGQVDNIFYKGDIKVLNSKVLDGKRSDHKPIIAELILQKC